MLKIPDQCFVDLESGSQRSTTKTNEVGRLKTEEWSQGKCMEKEDGEAESRCRPDRPGGGEKERKREGGKSRYP